MTNASITSYDIYVDFIDQQYHIKGQGRVAFLPIGVTAKILFRNLPIRGHGNVTGMPRASPFGDKRAQGFG
ncbi:hypothetical protein KSB_80640 [Ktedonobacter robiniae]|uniref:Uncharacterized protein n=1 Tax=Ktedonobacter robiniae TaxID=2778365 RepID=A0ABQ3V3X6_9CHLR|nr:hypothetical protein KSB_80640 [Ktedonobacter robiniae]